MTDQAQSPPQDKEIEAQELTPEQLEKVDGGAVPMQDIPVTKTLDKSSP